MRYAHGYRYSSPPGLPMNKQRQLLEPRQQLQLARGMRHSMRGEVLEPRIVPVASSTSATFKNFTNLVNFY